MKLSTVAGYLSGMTVVKIAAQAEIVITPVADSLSLSKQAARFLDPRPHLKHIAQHHDLIDVLLVEAIKRGSPVFDVLVDVGNQAKLHGKSLTLP